MWTGSVLFQPSSALNCADWQLFGQTGAWNGVGPDKSMITSHLHVGLSQSLFSMGSLFHLLGNHTMRLLVKRINAFFSEKHLWTNLEERCSEFLKFSLHFISDP